MGKAFGMILLLTAIALSLYFFLMNSDVNVSVRFTQELKTPSLPLGMVLLFTFFSGFVAGVLLGPLTYVIKRLS